MTLIPRKMNILELLFSVKRDTYQNLTKEEFKKKGSESRFKKNYSLIFTFTFNETKR